MTSRPARLATELIPINGATEALPALSDLPMGVVSNEPENQIRTSLMATNLKAVFAYYLFNAYEAQCRNPAPLPLTTMPQA